MQSSFRTWMLPEGVVEALPEEASKLIHLEQAALNLFSRWGYLPLRMPVFEYADTFIAGDVDNKLASQTVQIKDDQSGKQLGFRPDITPQVARVDAYYLRTDKIARYVYSGEVVRSYPAGHGGVKNPTIAGAELLGSNSVFADIEIVSLLLDYLQSIQLPCFVIQLGNVDIVIELLNALGVLESSYAVFFETLATKDCEKLEYLAKQNGIEETGLLSALTSFYGDQAILEKAESFFTKYPSVEKEIQKLSNIVEQLSQRYPDIELHIDLSDVHGFGYHNGLIFSAYADGVWKAVARGGRYDSYGHHFGEQTNVRPSTGFSCDLTLLASLLPKIENTAKVIGYTISDFCASEHCQVIAYVEELRQAGDTVVAIFGDEESDSSPTYRIVKTETGNFSIEAISSHHTDR